MGMYKGQAMLHEDTQSRQATCCKHELSGKPMYTTRLSCTHADVPSAMSKQNHPLSSLEEYRHPTP